MHDKVCPVVSSKPKNFISVLLFGLSSGYGLHARGTLCEEYTVWWESQYVTALDRSPLALYWSYGSQE